MVKSVARAVRLVQAICRLPSNRAFIADTAEAAAADGLAEMVASRDTAGLFEWLMDGFSYQGISDRNAATYIQRHGNARWSNIETALARGRCPCPKLAGFADYVRCGYRKDTASCANPTDLPSCPVPALPLRKGDLNQLAFSLFLFLRDRCASDLVGFIDQTFAAAELTAATDVTGAKREALIAAFSQVHAVSAKLIAMNFATLPMAGDPTRPDWIAVGHSMIAIDSLVHNFLHRTGILEAFDAGHSYGPKCYRQNGCAELLLRIADRIDASRINANYPKHFPRFIQYAIWSFCAEEQANICNGRRIDDRFPALAPTVRSEPAALASRFARTRVSWRHSPTRLGATAEIFFQRGHSRNNGGSDD